MPRWERVAFGCLGGFFASFAVMGVGVVRNSEAWSFTACGISFATVVIYLCFGRRPA